MSIEKVVVEQLCRDEIYIRTVVPSIGGTFDGARCIVAQHEEKPTRYLICDSCGKGYEGYLIRRSVSGERMYFCKHCDGEKQEQKIMAILHKQAVDFMRGKLDLIADQLCNRIIDPISIRIKLDDDLKNSIKNAVKNIFDTIRLEEL